MGRSAFRIILASLPEEQSLVGRELRRIWRLGRHDRFRVDEFEVLKDDGRSRECSCMTARKEMMQGFATP